MASDYKYGKHPLRIRTHFASERPNATARGIHVLMIRIHNRSQTRTVWLREGDGTFTRKAMNQNHQKPRQG